MVVADEEVSLSEAVTAQSWRHDFRGDTAEMTP
jgi:hypothetical protein